MKIAMIIPGRIAMYETGLIPVLNQSNHEIDLFLSLNGENCEYYDVMSKNLSKWLKGLHIEKFDMDREFWQSLKPHNWPNQHHCRIKNGLLIPYNPMSMYYNEKKAYEMAVEYSNKNNFEYDCYMKFRPDITPHTKWSELELNPSDKTQIYSATPYCSFITWGKHRLRTVCDAWAYGKKEPMGVYFTTYDYVLEKTKETDGNFFISFECSLVDNLVDRKIQWKFVNLYYSHLQYDKGIQDSERLIQIL